MIVFTGLRICAASVHGLLAMLAQIPFFLFRIKMDESMRGDYFDADFESYQSNTKRLIPVFY
jgi:protein-S-isoprenylcysteine O-methyltransferase Ste14